MNTSVAKPSGVELIDLIRNHIGEILAREEKNVSAMYLYRTGTYWAAFEKSAYRLSTLKEGVCIVPMKLFGVRNLIVTAGIEAEGNSLSVKDAALLENGQRMKVYRMHRTIVPAIYRKWHSLQTAVIAKSIRKGELQNFD